MYHTKGDETMKKWEKIVTALGAALFLYTAEPVFAFEPFYLNGDQTQPMIQNTGGIYNDGKTGLFMDLTSMTIEGVFNDGLAVRVKASCMSATQRTVRHGCFARMIAGRRSHPAPRIPLRSLSTSCVRKWEMKIAAIPT